jgi:hypothetical protein
MIMNDEARERAGKLRALHEKEKTKFCSEQKIRHRCRRDSVRWSAEENKTKLGQQQKQTHIHTFLPERESERASGDGGGKILETAAKLVLMDLFWNTCIIQIRRWAVRARAATPTAINSDLQVKSH